jgi:hypothetical protein
VEELVMSVELTDEELQTRLGRVPQDVIDRFAARIRAEALEEAAKLVDELDDGDYLASRIRALASSPKPR